MDLDEVLFCFVFHLDFSLRTISFRENTNLLNGNPWTSTEVGGCVWPVLPATGDFQSAQMMALPPVGSSGDIHLFTVYPEQLPSICFILQHPTSEWIYSIMPVFLLSLPPFFLWKNIQTNWSEDSVSQEDILYIILLSVILSVSHLFIVGKYLFYM